MIGAALVGGALANTEDEADAAGAWVNRYGGGASRANRAGAPAGWVNRAGGGTGWVNRW